MTQPDNTRSEHLRALARDVLEALVLDRAEADTDFGHWLDARLAVLRPREAGTPLDPAPFRGRAEALLSAAGSGRRGRRRYGRGAAVDEAELDDLIGEAAPFLGAGRGADALAILKPVAAALSEYWPECALWDETLHEYFPVLDRMIAQAVLMDGSSQEARDALADELGGWQDDIAEHGADDAFSVSIAACLQGWDAPGLADAIAGRGQGRRQNAPGGWKTRSRGPGLRRSTPWGARTISSTSPGLPGSSATTP